jgi:hypothetical protein
MPRLGLSGVAKDSPDESMGKAADSGLTDEVVRRVWAPPPTSDTPATDEAPAKAAQGENQDGSNANGLFLEVFANARQAAAAAANRAAQRAAAAVELAVARGPADGGHACDKCDVVLSQDGVNSQTISVDLKAPSPYTVFERVTATVSQAMQIEDSDVQITDANGTALATNADICRAIVNSARTPLVASSLTDAAETRTLPEEFVIGSTSQPTTPEMGSFQDSPAKSATKVSASASTSQATLNKDTSQVLALFERRLVLVEKKAEDAMFIANSAAISDPRGGETASPKAKLDRLDFLERSLRGIADQVKPERFDILEQRLDGIVAQVSAEIAQERKLREAVVEAMTVKLDTVVGLVEKVFADGAPGIMPGLPQGQGDSDYDIRSSPTRGGDDDAGSIESRCEALVSAQAASARDLEAAEAALRGVSGDVSQMCETHWQQILKVATHMTGLGREIVRRVEKIETTSNLQTTRIAELGIARSADAKRLDEQAVKLRSQSAEQKSQAECLSSAIDAILSWIGESESSGFAAVVERLSSLGDRLEQSDSQPDGVDLNPLRALRGDSRSAAKDALGATRANLNMSRTEVSPVSLPRSQASSRTASERTAFDTLVTTTATAPAGAYVVTHPIATMPIAIQNAPLPPTLAPAQSMTNIMPPLAASTQVSAPSGSPVKATTPETGGGPMSAGRSDSSGAQTLAAIRATSAARAREAWQRRVNSASPTPMRGTVGAVRNLYARDQTSSPPPPLRRVEGRTPSPIFTAQAGMRSRSPTRSVSPSGMRSNYFTQKVLPPMLMQPPPGTQATLMKSFGTDVKTVQGSAPSFAFGAQGTRGAPATMVPLPPSPSGSGSPMMPLGGASTPMSTSWSETSSTLGAAQPAVAQATSSQSRQSPIRTDSHLIQASMSRAAATSREKTNLMKAASMPAMKAESNLMKAASMPAVQAGGTGTSPQRGLSPEGSSQNVSIHERTQRPFRRLIAQGIGFSPEH